MQTEDFRNILGAIMATVFLATGVVMADDHGSTESEPADAQPPATPDLPQPVAKLIAAISGVQRVQAVDNGNFAVHRRISVTGSRLMRDVTMLVADDGTVVDWGDTPALTRQYTRRELYQTGQLDIAEALDQLDPRIQSGDGR